VFLILQASTQTPAPELALLQALAALYLTGSKLSDAIGKISAAAGHNRHTAVTVSWQFARALA